MRIAALLPVTGLAIVFACTDAPSPGATPPVADDADAGVPPPDASAPPAPPNPLDTLDPTTGSFAAGRAIALAYLAEAESAAVGAEARIFPFEDPLRVISALDVTERARTEDESACANTPGGCRNPTDAQLLLSTFTSVIPDAKKVLLDSLDAYDRWALVAAVPEALAYAHLLEGAKLLKPEDITRIGAAVTAFSAKTSLPKEALDLRNAFPNTPLNQIFARSSPVLPIPAADTAAAARDVILAVTSGFADADALLAPFLGDGTSEPSSMTKAFQTARSAFALPSLAKGNDKAAFGAAADAYLARLSSIVAKNANNALTDADWDGYLVDADALIRPFDLRKMVFGGFTLLEPPKHDFITPIATSTDDPNVELPMANEAYPTPIPPYALVSIGGYCDPTPFPAQHGAALPYFVSPRASVTRPALSSYAFRGLGPGATCAFGWGWHAPKKIDHFELRVTEYSGVAAGSKTLPVKKPTHRFVYREHPDGTIDRMTKYRFDVPKADLERKDPLQYLVVFEINGIDVDGHPLSTDGIYHPCFAIQLSSKPGSRPQDLASEGFACQPQTFAPVADPFADATIPPNTLVVDSAGAIHPFDLVLSPGATSVYVHNAMAAPVRLQSLFTPRYADSGSEAIGGVPALDTGEIPAKSGKSIPLPAARAGYTWWVGSRSTKASSVHVAD